MTNEELYQEIQKLKAVQEIQDITYQYWLSIDSKDSEGLRDVFAPGEIYIYFQDMPIWRSRDEFVAFFDALAHNPTRNENHFGSSPRIVVHDENSASGTWRLNMFAYNSEFKTVIRVTGEYDAGYCKVDGKWKINKFVSKFRSLFSENVNEEGYVVVPVFGGPSKEAWMHLMGEEMPA